MTLGPGDPNIWEKLPGILPKCRLDTVAWLSVYVLYDPQHSQTRRPLLTVLLSYDSNNTENL